MFVSVVSEFLGIAPESCIIFEYIFAGILFLATFLSLVLFLYIFLFSVFGFLRK